MKQASRDRRGAPQQRWPLGSDRMIVVVAPVLMLLAIASWMRVREALSRMARCLRITSKSRDT